MYNNCTLYKLKSGRFRGLDNLPDVWNLDCNYSVRTQLITELVKG